MESNLNVCFGLN